MMLKYVGPPGLTGLFIHTIDTKWLPGLIGDTERPEMARSVRISYSGSYGSMGTQNTRNG